MFSGAKRTSTPIYKYPKNIKQSLQIVQIYENGIFQLEKTQYANLYDRCYIFDDINYNDKDDDDKRSILLQMMQWLKSMNVNFKIEIANEHRNINEFLEEILSRINKDVHPENAEGLKQWISEKMKEGNPEIRQVRYLIVTCKAKSYEDAKVQFNILDLGLQNYFSKWESRLYLLNAQERLKALHTFFHPKEEYQILSERMRTDSWKNDILPTSIESFPNFMIMDTGKQYVSVLYAKSFSSTLDESRVISSFSNLPFQSHICLDYAPIDKQLLKNKLDNAYMNNEKAITQELEMRQRRNQYTLGTSYSKERKKEELEGYKEQVEENDEGCLFLGFLILVTAESEKELEQRIQEVKAIGRSNGVYLEIYYYRQLKALHTALPYGGRQVDVMRSLLTSSAVAFNPYYAKDLQGKGFVYGINRRTHRLLMGDRKQLKSPHGIIIGHTGSGKSILIKMTEILQTLLSTRDDLTVIDPQNEFADVSQDFAGEFFDLTPKSDIHINPMEIPDEVFYEKENMRKEQFVADVTDWAISFCIAIMTNILVTQEHYSIIGRCMRKIYEKYFQQKSLEKQPTLKDFRKELYEELNAADNESDMMLIRQLYNSLEEYTEGSYDMFAHQSNLNIKKRFVVFGLKNVSEKIWEAVMVTIMHFLAARMKYNQKLQKATRLIIDECQVVCAHKSSADMLLNAVVTYRKFGGICTMALQNMTRAIENPELRDMFSNCDYKIFLDQGGVDAKALAQIQEFSKREYESLNTSTPGYGVMVWKNQVYLLDSRISKSNILYKKFSTNFHEKAAQNRERENAEYQERNSKYQENSEKDKNQKYTEKISKKYLEESDSRDSGSLPEKSVCSQENIYKILVLSKILAITIADISKHLKISEKQADDLVNHMVQKDLLIPQIERGVKKYKAKE